MLHRGRERYMAVSVDTSKSTFFLENNVLFVPQSFEHEPLCYQENENNLQVSLPRITTSSCPLPMLIPIPDVLVPCRGLVKIAQWQQPKNNVSLCFFLL